MGGNRFIRKDYTDDQIRDLFEKYMRNENKLISLFSGKDKKTIKLWKYDLAINMSRDSKAKLQHLINGYNGEVPNCTTCGNNMQLCDLMEINNTYKNHCSNCISKHIWSTNQVLTKDKLLDRAKKISDRKKEYYQTDAGKEFAERIGRINSIKMKEFSASPEGIKVIEKNAKLASIRMREKIAKGEFTPAITNSRTHWEAKIILNGRTKKFRSSWEACFWLCNQHLDYESYRIPYDNNGIIKTYIADFFDYTTKTLYEIKPVTQWLKVNTKMQQIIEFCLTNDIKFIWLNEKNIMNFVDEKMFNEDNLPQLNMLLKGIK